MAESPRRPGRPSLGERLMVPVRIHPDLKEAVTQAAKNHGMTVNGYIAALIAADTGLTNLVPPIQQEALPHPA